jgi:putative PIN family toxin of toxin-antitoxin system
VRPVVIDTNVVLDLLVFADQAVAPLREGLRQQRLRWLATAVMRDELQRVLAYPKLAARLAFHGREPGAILRAYDAGAALVEIPERAPMRCQDPDDQKFIDLAVAHRGLLLSKDREVLRMRKRLAAADVQVAAVLDAALLSPAP